MKENQLDILKENLERRFSILIKNKNYMNLFESKMEYLNYLFSEEISGKIIENLIKKSKIGYDQKLLIQVGYLDNTIGNIFRQTENGLRIKKAEDCIELPFYNKFIDSKLQLKESCIKQMKNIFGEIKNQKEFQEFSNLKPNEFNDKIKIVGEKLVKEAKRRNKEPIKIVDDSDTEINKFSCLHFLLIEEINSLKNESIQVKGQSKNHENTEEIELIVGPLSYKNNLIYHKGSVVKDLTPQMIKMCVLFMENKEKFVSYSTIRDEISKGEYIEKKNMQKLVSKLRKKLTTLTKENLIKIVQNKGYIFEAKKIL